jgi:hypothetical protein
MFYLVSFLAKKDTCEDARVFFCKKARSTKSFCPRIMINCQHQHKDKPRTQEKSQSAKISVDDAIIIIKGLNSRCALYLS